MIARPSNGNKALWWGGALLALFFVPSIRAEATGELPPGALGRAGPVVLDPAGLLEAIEEARVLQRWRSGEPAPMAALASPMLRRRVLIKALETRVVRLEAERRGLQVPPTALSRALRNAAEGRPYDAPRAEEPPLDPDTLSARLAQRFGAPSQRVRRVALDLLESAALARALLDAETDDAHERRWREANTRLVLDVVQVPRVPASGEIEAKARLDQIEIVAWYAGHRGQFQRPARLRVSRILVSPASAEAAAWAAARAEVERLRAEVAAGADFAEVARRAGGGPEARRGGALGALSPEALPPGVAGPEGSLSAAVRVPEGWAVYRVDGKVAAVSRPVEDAQVQREIAATLLREQDVLPRAQGIAAEAEALLRRDPGGAALASLVQRHRLKRSTTRPFSLGGPPLVPGVGASPALFAAAFALTPSDPVSAVHVVRQDYVVARLVRREVPDADRWPAERAAFIEGWRARSLPTVVDRWLSERLAGQPLWVDAPALNALALPEVGPATTRPGPR